MRKLVAAFVMAGVIAMGFCAVACSAEHQDGYNAPAPEAQTGKLVKKPKIGGPGKPVIGKPKNK